MSLKTVMSIKESTGIPHRYHGLSSKPPNETSILIKRVVTSLLVKGLAFSLKKTQHL